MDLYKQMVETVAIVPQTEGFLNYIDEVEDFVDKLTDSPVDVPMPADNCCTLWPEVNY